MTAAFSRHVEQQPHLEDENAQGATSLMLRNFAAVIQGFCVAQRRGPEGSRLVITGLPPYNASPFEERCEAGRSL